MGLLSDLLLFPIMGPVHGFRFVLEQIAAEVDAQRLDEGRVEAELMGLAVRHDLGEISDAEYAEQETVLLEQLNAIRAYKQALMESDTDTYTDPYMESDTDIYMESDTDTYTDTYVDGDGS